MLMRRPGGDGTRVQRSSRRRNIRLKVLHFERDLGRAHQHDHCAEVTRGRSVAGGSYV